jgi:23S rRNA (uracil1939-C5)-methyltransferase
MLLAAGYSPALMIDNTQANPGPLPRKGDQVELLALGIGSRGHVLAEVCGIPVRIKGCAAPGDRVKVRLLRKGRGVFDGRLLEVLEAGPEHTDPPCRHAGTCGGCSFQAVSYPAQLKAKWSWIQSALAESDLTHVPDVQPIIGMRDPWHYRNKMDFTFGSRRWIEEHEEQGVVADFGLGLHVPGRWDKVLDIEECLIAFPEAAAILNSTRRYAREQNLDPWDVKESGGLLRHLVLRKGFHTGEILVDLVTETTSPERIDPLAAALLAAHPEITTMVQGIHARSAKVAFHEEQRILHGEGIIHEVLAGCTFEISPTSFFQTNTLQAERLVQCIGEAAGLQNGDVLFDLYCGAGTLGLCLAKQQKDVRVFGFESVEASVQDARRNAAANGAANCEFRVGDVRAVLEGSADGDLPRPDVVLIDPPRAGLHPKVPAQLAALKPRRMVLVSCNPVGTMADLARLEFLGWHLTHVQPLDLFPQTPHVECVFTLSAAPMP